MSQGPMMFDSVSGVSGVSGVSASTHSPWADQFLQVLYDLGDRRSSGFVVMVRGTTSIAALQDVCDEPILRHCLSARYRLAQPSIGSLLAAFVSDIAAPTELAGSTAGRPVVGDLRPDHSGTDWQRLRTDAIIAELARAVHRRDDGRLSPDWQQLFLHAVDDAVPDEQRLVLFAEVERVPGDDAEWTDVLELARRLPRRLALVLVGQEASQQYPSNGPVLELAMTPDAQPELVAHFVDAPLTGDQLAEVDTLDRRWYATALANLIMLPDTGPMTIGVHARWGVGKSSFMRFVRWELLRNALADRPPHVHRLEIADRRVENAATDLRDAGPDVARVNQFRALYAWALRHRAELLHRLERAAADTVLCVRFNAWLYEGATQVWAGLTHEITRAMEDSLPWHRRLAARVRYAWLVHGPGYWVGAALGVLSAALVAGLALVLGYGDAGSAVARSLPSGLDVIALALPAGSVVAIGLLLVWRLSRGFVPVSGRIAQYLRRPDYRAQMGYQHQLRRDIEFLKARLRRGDRTPRVVVFIDDLDRCSDERVLETLQAINLLLTESGCYVFLGIDTEMIVNAIRRQYETEASATDTEQRARGYLDKILQLNVPLRVPDQDRQLQFLAEFFSPEGRRAAEIGDNPPEPPGDEWFEPVDAGELPWNRRLVSAPPEQDYQVHEVEDTADELAAFAALRQYLPDNPRELKRLVNVHRLVRLLVRQGGRRSGPAERQLIVGWLLFCFARPAAAADAAAAARAHPDRAATVQHDELTPFLLPDAAAPSCGDLYPGTPLGEAWEISALFRRHTATNN